MKRVSIILFVVAIAFLSCEKSETNSTEKVSDYFPLKVGNYWIYQSYLCDSLDFDCQEYEIDSIYISKDTIMNGNTYFKIEGTRFGWEEKMFVRDSDNFIISSSGIILFAINNFTNPVYEDAIPVSTDDSICTIEYNVSAIPEMINTPAGNFEAYNTKETFYRKSEDFSIPRHLHNYYSKNIGLIYESQCYVGGLEGMKIELVRYHLE